jgi:hypothetical protein
LIIKEDDISINVKDIGVVFAIKRYVEKGLIG